MVNGIFRLMASVAISDDVKKHPQSHANSERTVPINPFRAMNSHCSFVGQENTSTSV